MFLFRWRAAFSSSKGPPSSTTRLVLWALSSYMDKYGKRAFPSIERLALDTALTPRSVGDHLRRAERAGWIERKPWRNKGKDWAQYAYVARVPAKQDGEERGSYAKPQGGESHDEAAEFEHQLDRNDVPTNSSLISSTNSPKNREKGAFSRSKGFEDFMEKGRVLGLYGGRRRRESTSS
jgi:hypothetical protein